MRTIPFKSQLTDRYWWFRATNANYIPPVFAALSDDEWAIMEAWYEDSDATYKVGTGECNVPAVSFLSGLIGGNNISRVVQLGHYIGFSSLLLGWQLRSMGEQHRLISFDVDATVTAYTAGWIERARLSDHVNLVVSDSAAPNAPEVADAYLGGAPELVFLDSSHQYAHTLRELDTWYDRLAPGGMIVMHDASQFATTYDAAGGVLRALKEWSAKNGVPYFAINERVTGKPGEPRPVYRDGCGLGLIQRLG